MALSDIDVTLRSETASNPLTANQYDNSMLAIQNAVNALNAAVNPLHEYGEMYQAGNTNATTLSTGTFVQVANFTGDHLDGVTFASNALVLTAGDWVVSTVFSITGGTTNDVLQFGFGIVGAHDPKHLCEQKLQNADTQVLSLVGIIEATAGQALSLMVNRVSGSGNITVKHATVYAHRKE